MSLSESFREKLDREREIREEERRLKWEREEKEFRAASLRFQEEIETRGRPFIDVLFQSKIFDLVEELAREKEDMKLEMRLEFGFGNLDSSHCEFIDINKNGELHWEEDRLKHERGRAWLPGISSDTYTYRMADIFDLYRYKKTPVEVVKLQIFLRWDYRMSWVSDGGDVVVCDTITPFEIERRRRDFCITIGKNLLGPRDWNSPEKVENVIIQEFLRAD